VTIRFLRVSHFVLGFGWLVSWLVNPYLTKLQREQPFKTTLEFAFLPDKAAQDVARRVYKLDEKGANKKGANKKKSRTNDDDDDDDDGDDDDDEDDVDEGNDENDSRE
jgi:phosphopantothenoylcysteine synthetase/decarboxylase